MEPGFDFIGIWSTYVIVSPLSLPGNDPTENARTVYH